MDQNKIEPYFFLITFVIVLGLTFFLFLSFLGALAVAAVLAVIFYPVHSWFLERLKWKNISALLTTILILLIVFVPLSFLGFLLFGEAQGLFFELNQGDVVQLNTALGFIESKVSSFSPGFSIDASAYLSQGLNWLTESLGSVFISTATAILSFFIGVISLFYFLRDGEWFRKVFVKYSPLRDEYDNEIVEKIKRTINAILKGSLLVALIQGTLSGIGFFIFGVPNPVLWGSIAAIGALMPGIGTTIVLIPAILYLLFFSGGAAALGLALWGAIAVGLVDNLLGPILIGRSVRIHPLFILLSVLGGLNVFGAVGFILGPIIFSLLLVFGEIYSFLVMRDGKEERKA